MKPATAVKTIFLACQIASVVYALSLDGRAAEPFLLASFFFLGAVIGASVYGRSREKEVTHG